jgi:hypothetical protein
MHTLNPVGSTPDDLMPTTATTTMVKKSIKSLFLSDIADDL